MWRRSRSYWSCGQHRWWWWCNKIWAWFCKDFPNQFSLQSLITAKLESWLHKQLLGLTKLDHLYIQIIKHFVFFFSFVPTIDQQFFFFFCARIYFFLRHSLFHCPNITKLTFCEKIKEMRLNSRQKIKTDNLFLFSIFYFHSIWH